MIKESKLTMPITLDLFMQEIKILSKQSKSWMISVVIRKAPIKTLICEHQSKIVMMIFPGLPQTLSPRDSKVEALVPSEMATLSRQSKLMRLINVITIEKPNPAKIPGVNCERSLTYFRKTEGNGQHSDGNEGSANVEEHEQIYE